MYGDRQLQHRRALALAKAREQNDLPVWEFQRIVMDRGVLHVDLPETRELLPDFLVGEDADAKHRFALNILVERNLRAGQRTDGKLRLPNRGKGARDRIAELGRHQLVLDLGRPGRHIVQTIVTHRRNSSPCEPGFDDWTSLATRGLGMQAV